MKIYKKYKKHIALAIAVVMISIILYYVFSIIQFGQDIHEDDANPPPNQHRPNEGTADNEPPEWQGEERVNIMLLGVDARDADRHGNTRSDTIMVLSVDPVTKQVHLFSVMRDTYVPIPGYGQGRVNAAHAFGGPSLAMQTVGDLLDLPIHYYVSIDFEGFIALVDAIGGIEFEVEKNMRYVDPTDDPAYGTIDLQAGLQVLDGEKALQYVRFRHDLYSDYSRTERQRNLMTAVAKEMLTFSSVLKLPSTLRDIQPYIKTNLTLEQMWALGNLGFKTRNSEIVTEQLPPSSLLREEKINGADVITVNTDSLRAHVHELLQAPSAPSEPDAEAEPGASAAAGSDAAAGAGAAAGAVAAQRAQ